MKNFYHVTQYILIFILFILFKIVGFKASSNFGFFIGKYLGPLFRPKSSIINNLKKAQISGDYKKIATNVLGNYGRIFAEYVHLKNFKNDRLNNHISIEGREYLDRIKNKKQSVVFISGHFNNFELMAMHLEKSNIDLAAVYRPLNNMFLNPIMEKIREKYICKKQIKKGISGTKELLKEFKKGTSIALMIDQRVSEGIKSDFFGKEALTTTIPAQFVKKFNTDVVPIYVERLIDNTFKLKIHDSIKFSNDETIDSITRKLNKILEKMIMSNPDQWIWTHSRWKI